MQLVGGRLVKLREGWLGTPITLGADSLWSSFHMTRRAFERSVARTRCLRIINAWAANGDFTLPLAALGLMPQNRLDPFTEQPLKVKSTPGGPIVYSVGEDLNDDGGEVEGSKDVGFGPTTESAAPK